MMKTAILLINIGTPDKPTVRSVRKYLFQFLNDKHVIDLPWLARIMLVNLIIVPFRAPKSTKLYQRLWTDKGSPLLFHAKNLQNKLQNKVKSQADIFVAMRYGNPSIKNVLDKIKADTYQKVVVLPLFPQYASSTSGTIIKKVEQEISKWKSKPNLHIIDQFYNHPAYLDAFTKKIDSYNPKQYDHIIFSYHGLPNRHLDKIHPQISSINCSCQKAMPTHGKRCYKATCYETTRQLVKRLDLKKNNYSVAFQSRLSKNWMKPFTDETLINEVKNGKKRILIIAPSFVADCLETIVEIGHEYKELFIENGGKKLTLVESMNSDDDWVDAVQNIIAHLF